MKKHLFFLLFSFHFLTFAQKDSLQIGDRYADDQLYVSISYNQLFEQPSVIGKSDFSYGISMGFMKDFILNKQGSFAVAAGVGYGYDSFTHDLQISEFNNSLVFSPADGISSNNISIHNLEFPIQLRWRTSSANVYKFWRVYAGVKVLRNISNEFSYTMDSLETSFKNIDTFNQWQYGLTLSAGYDVFNFHLYYGLSPILKNALLTSKPINTKILKFGLVFYIL